MTQRLCSLYEFIETQCITLWRAFVLFAMKKNCGLRFCVDQRTSNQLTPKIGHRLARIDQLLDTLCEAKYSEIINLFSRCLQIYAGDSSISKSSLKTKHASLEYTIVPFSPAYTAKHYQCWS